MDNAEFLGNIAILFTFLSSGAVWYFYNFGYGLISFMVFFVFYFLFAVLVNCLLTDN